MYSGNHSPCHPLDTLLQAAERLAENEDIAFCFVGGGSEFVKVKERARRPRLAQCAVHSLPADREAIGIARRQPISTLS